MSLSQDLKKLKKQRRQTVKDLHLTYLHTRRDLRRTISPDRHIRRHLGVALGLAAVTGMILAPAPGRAGKPKSEKRRKKKSGGGNFLAKILRPLLIKFVPEARDYLPDLENTAEVADYYDEHPGMVGPPPPSYRRREEREEAEPPRERKNAAMQPLFLELAMLLLKRLDLQKIVGQLMQRFSKNPDHDGHPEGPHVTVDDAGTIHPPAHETP